MERTFDVFLFDLDKMLMNTENCHQSIIMTSL